MIQTIAGTCRPNWDYLGQLVYETGSSILNAGRPDLEEEVPTWKELPEEAKEFYIQMALAVWNFAEKYQSEPLRKELEMLKNPPKITYTPTSESHFMDMDGRVYRKSSK